MQLLRIQRQGDCFVTFDENTLDVAPSSRDVFYRTFYGNDGVFHDVFYAHRGCTRFHANARPATQTQIRRRRLASISLAQSFFVKSTGIGCRFFLKNVLPSSLGNTGITLSSAKNKSYESHSFLFASCGL